MRSVAILTMMLMISGAAWAKGTEAEAKVKCKEAVVRLIQIYDATKAMPLPPTPETETGRAELRRRTSVLKSQQTELSKMTATLMKADYPDQYEPVETASAALGNWVQLRLELQTKNRNLSESATEMVNEKQAREMAERRLAKARALFGL